jgi:hypothetical protein
MGEGLNVFWGRVFNFKLGCFIDKSVLGYVDTYPYPDLKTCPSGLYYKHITIVNEAFRVIRMTIVSDAATWSITNNRN